MENEKMIPGRVYAHDCLLKKEIKGFIQVPDNIPDRKLISYLENPDDEAKLLSNKYKLVRELANIH